jgi:peptidoglycan/LPS O-acetylase OafA/YrhL
LLGLFRFVLALMVVFQHLSGHRLFAYFGVYAVMGFYVVSGYLMTAVLNDTYKFDPKRFWANRFLRLFPIYYLVAAITAVLIFAYPDDAGSMQHYAWQNFSWYDLPGQVLIFPYELRSAFRVVPSTWSVSVEIVNYALLWLIIARSWRLALAAFIVSGAYHVSCLWSGTDWALRYFPWYAAVLPFSVGALSFFSLQRGLVVKLPVVAIATVGFGANVLITGFINTTYVTVVGLYLDIALITIILAGLAPLRDARLIGTIDRKLGDLAYPVFLVHWLVGLIVVVALEPMIAKPSPLLLVAALPPILIASAVLAWIGDKMIEPIRASIRTSDIPRSTPDLPRWLRRTGLRRPIQRAAPRPSAQRGAP